MKHSKVWGVSVTPEEMPTNLKETIIVLLISVCVVKLSACGQWSHNFSNRWEGVVISGKGNLSGKYVNVDRAMSQRFCSLPKYFFSDLGSEVLVGFLTNI